MKYLMILTVGMFLLFASVPAMADQAQDEAAIRKVTEQRAAAWNAKDAKAYLALHDEACVDGYGGEPCGAALRESGEFPKAQKNLRIRVLEQGVVFITPDVALNRITVEISGAVDADGKPQPPEKSQLPRVYVKKNGKWLVAVSGFSQPIEE